jgi:hypothetical protein
MKTEIRMFQPWRPGKAPTQITAELNPLWAWPVASRRNLWHKRRHPKALRHRLEVLSTEVIQ